MSLSSDEICKCGGYKKNHHNCHSEENNMLSDVNKQYQQDFLILINKMITSSCPLPNFPVYYMTMYHADRRGAMFKIRPFLTEQGAYLACGEDQEWEDKYGSFIQYEVFGSTNRVILQNYDTGSNHGTEIDIQVPSYFSGIIYFCLDDVVHPVIFI